MKKLLLLALFVATNAFADPPQWWDGAWVTESDNPAQWGPNITAHSETNIIDSMVHTSTIGGGGYAGRPNLIGTNIGDPLYVPGSARIALIDGGYDNTNNQLAGTIGGGAHHFLYSMGDHGTIGGGSTIAIWEGSYSTAGGGKNIDIYGSGVGVGGGIEILADCHYCFVGSGENLENYGYGSGIGAGRDIGVYAAFSFASGRYINIESHAFGSAAFGFGVDSTSPGSVNVSGRGKDGQGIFLNLNNKTVQNNVVHLLGAGTWTTPKIPDNSVWSGTLQLTVASDLGSVAVMEIKFVAASDRVVDVQVIEQIDEIGVEQPIFSLVDRRILIYVAGESGHVLTWNASGVISQANL